MGQGGLMGRGVDAAGQSRDHEKAGRTQRGGNLAGEFQAESGGGTGADNGGSRQLQHGRIAFHAEEDGRLVNLAEQRRVTRLADGDEPRP
jgi:hypothetical protein